MANNLTQDRRSLLLTLVASAAAYAAGSTALSGPARAAGETVSTLLLAPTVQGPLQPLLETISKTKIENGTFLSSTDTIAKLLGPASAVRWDLMMALTELARGALLGGRAGQEKAQALDRDLIPNFANIAEPFKKVIVERDGKIFGIPWYWGYDTVVYNKDHVKEEGDALNTWGLIFGDKYAGRVAWQDEPYYTLLIAGLYLGHKAPHKATRSEIDEIAKFLISKKKNVRAFWQTQAQQVSLMSSGEVVALHGTIPTRVALQRQGMNVTNNWPKESTVVWSGVQFIPKPSRNAKAAQAVINAALSKEFGAALTKVSGYLSTNLQAAAEMSPEARAAAGYDIMERGYKVFDYKLPDDLNLFVEAWGRVKRA